MEEEKKSNVVRNLIITAVIVIFILAIVFAVLIWVPLFKNGIPKFRDAANNITEKQRQLEAINEQIMHGGDTKAEEQKKVEDYIYVGGYKITCGTYIGYETMFNWETQKEYKVEIKVKIAKDSVTMDGQTTKYTISGNQIVVNGMPRVQAVGNNTLQSLAQSMPDLIYQGY